MRIRMRDAFFVSPADDTSFSFFLPIPLVGAALIFVILLTEFPGYVLLSHLPIMICVMWLSFYHSAS